MSNKSDLRVSNVKYHFNTRGFEFVFQWVLGAQTNGASEVGESFFAASQVNEGSAPSWVKAWANLARQVEERAETARSRNHLVSAREAYFRAYTYYRAAHAFISPFNEEEFKPVWQKGVECFRKAAALACPVIEQVLIPFEDSYLPGYFVPATTERTKTKTLLVIGGADTFVEDLYIFLGPAANKRGYNLFFVDLPGQGGLPFEGLHFRPDSEVPMKRVIDYLLTRPEVEPDQIAAFGISAGGYLLPRAATVEKRITACVACSIISDFYAYLTQNPAMLNLAKAENSRWMKLLIRLRRLEPSMVLMETYKWRWGVKTLSELMEVQHPFHFDPAQIDCPLLTIIGEKEFNNGTASRQQQQQAILNAPNPNKQLILATAAQGGDAHSIATNMSLLAQLVFDWLDEVLAKSQFARV